MTAMNYKLLNLLKYKNLYNWSVQFVNPVEVNFSKKFVLVKIGEVLKRNKIVVIINDKTKYKRVTVRLYGNGVKIRDEVLGKEIKTKRQFLLKKGQFLFSRIDARNGAFGLATPEVNNAIVTNDFPVFDINEAKIIPEFLAILTGSKLFFDFFQNLSSGSTGRQRSNESDFLDFQIPLPNIITQNQIVTQYNYKLLKGQNVENQANELEKGIEKYLLDELGIEVPKLIEKGKGLQFVRLKELSRWDLWNSNVEMNSKFNLKKMNDLILQISTGTTPPTSNAEYFNGNIEFYTPSDLTNNIYLSKAGRTVSELAVSHKKVRIFPKNTLLYVGIGSTVGKVGIVGNDFATANQQITGIVFKEELNIEYIYYFFNYNKRFTTKESSKTTLPIVNQKAILNIKIPIPPIEIQTQIVNHITSQKEQIKTLRHQAETLRKQAKEEFEQEIFI